MPYHHLSEFEREVISQMYYANCSFSEIGAKLGRNKGTICREIRRNCLARSGSYYPAGAHLRYQARRHKAKASQRKKISVPRILRYVLRKLKQEWSPEQIAGRMKRDYPQDSEMRITHTSIYKWLKEDKRRGGRWYRYLRQANHRRRRYGRNTKRYPVEGKVSIDDRPLVVARRKRKGDWEGDLMQGKDRKSYLLTYTERKSGYLLVRKIGNKSATSVFEATVAMFRDIPVRYRKTITYDNGTEFSRFRDIESATGMKCYFAHPYSSWERGTNENTNGLIRQYVPKSKDIRRTRRPLLAKVKRRLNNRPRKRLGYRTPNEVLKAQRQPRIVALQN